MSDSASIHYLQTPERLTEAVNMRSEEPPVYETREKGAQLEDGYFKIANELGRAFARTSLGIRESRIVWAVICKTYGWQKKLDRISGTQLAELTGITPEHCYRTVTKLLKRKVLVREGTKFGKVGINTKFWQWQNSSSKYENLPKTGMFKNSGEPAKNGHVKPAKNRHIEPAKNGHTQKTIKDNERQQHPDSVKSGSEEVQSARTKKPQQLNHCPYQKILDLWAEHFPHRPQPRNLSSRWQRIIKSGWMYASGLKHMKTNEPLFTDIESGLEWWDRFMAYIAENNRWVAFEQRNFDLEYLMLPRGIDRIMSGKYEENGK